MSEPKPFASLSSGLLARKGAAKPAMRPQGFGQMGVSLEDLGWDDMGHAPSPSEHYESEPREHVPSSITALTPAPREHSGPEPDQEQAGPSVVEQQRAIAASFAKEEARRSVAVAPAVRAPAKTAAVVSLPRQAQDPADRKAAFTLRLDAERHLKLRLACVVVRRSAQQLVIAALDQYLESLPELDALADQLPARLAKRH
jgi:hypothetical protein